MWYKFAVMNFDNETIQNFNTPLKKKKIYYMDYEDAKRWAQYNKIKNQMEFEMKRPPQIPLKPYDYYGKLGLWKGWDDFLGKTYQKQFIKKDNYVSYGRAKEWAIQNNIKSEMEWLTTPKPKTIPMFPATYYANDWNGWKDFLNETTFYDNRKTTTHFNKQLHENRGGYVNQEGGRGMTQNDRKPRPGPVNTKVIPKNDVQ